MIAWTPGLGQLEKVLAVIGGAALGFVCAGLLLQLLIKATTGKRTPRPALVVVRLLGGIALGMIVYLFLFGTGGGGFGGPGGWGWGSRNGNSPNENEDKEPPKDGTQDGKPGQVEGSIRVEVLGDKAVRRILGEQQFKAERRYRIAGSPELHTLDEVKKLVEERQKQKPPVTKLEVFVYLDSPAEDKPVVTDLYGLAAEHNLTPSTVKPPNNAP